MKYYEVDFYLDYIQKKIVLDQVTKSLSLEPIEVKLEGSKGYDLELMFKEKFGSYIENSIVLNKLRDIKEKTGVSIDSVYNEIKNSKPFKPDSYYKKSELAFLAKSLNIHSSKFLNLLNTIDDVCESLSPKRKEIFTHLEKIDQRRKILQMDNKVINFLKVKKEESHFNQHLESVSNNKRRIR